MRSIRVLKRSLHNIRSRLRAWRSYAASDHSGRRCSWRSTLRVPLVPLPIATRPAKRSGYDHHATRHSAREGDETRWHRRSNAPQERPVSLREPVEPRDHTHAGKSSPPYPWRHLKARPAPVPVNHVPIELYLSQPTKLWQNVSVVSGRTMSSESTQTQWPRQTHNEHTSFFPSQINFFVALGYTFFFISAVFLSAGVPATAYIVSSNTNFFPSVFFTPQA